MLKILCGEYNVSILKTGNVNMILKDPLVIKKAGPSEWDRLKFEVDDWVVLTSGLALAKRLNPHWANFQLSRIRRWIVAGAGEDIDRHVVETEAGEDGAAR